MELENFHKLLLILYFVTVKIAVEPVAGTLSYENKDFVKINQDPTRFQQASAYVNKEKQRKFSSRDFNATTLRQSNNFHTYRISGHSPMGVGRNYSNEKNNIVNNKTVTKASPYKKWQVGRVSRKQYEIINMLWRKTKIFVNVEQTTTTYHQRRDNDTKKVIDIVPALRKSFLRNPRETSRSNLPSTTPSYIEFYYLDETDEHGKEFASPKYTNMRENQLRNLGNFKFVLADSPMFAFRIDDPHYKRPIIPTRYMHPTNRMRRRKTRTHDSSLRDFESLNSLTPTYKFPRKHKHKEKITTKLLSTMVTDNSERNFLNMSNNNSKAEYVTNKQHRSTTEYAIDNETCPATTEVLITFSEITENENLTTPSTNMMEGTESTTIYDKIKFFELYDKHTPVPYYDEKGKLIDMDNTELYIKENELNDERKILLEHVDQSIGNEHSNPHKAKHSKKHITDSYKGDSKGQSNDNLVVKKIIVKRPVNASMAKLLNITKPPINKLTQSESTVTNFFENRKSKHAQWSQYPFSAAYVYEPTQVHCDAAAVSPHWLVTSGACLSRHHKNPGGGGRSAFVTYCGDSWWNPERVAYVKYSIVHPRFHPRDKTRRHLYNMGLIQVVTSMASACYGWAPLSLMSHQFVTDMGGSIANAIGWGLDRFDTRYSSSDLPKLMLTTYESQVFSDSCPGNVGYSKAKRLDEEGGIKNVYCLALPPYSGEETDPVHGGLLLVGGKLVALYLQEERRPWGDQCAQYTGTWRLVPWVLDVARENEEADSFTLEI